MTSISSDRCLSLFWIWPAGSMLDEGNAAKCSRKTSQRAQYPLTKKYSLKIQRGPYFDIRNVPPELRGIGLFGSQTLCFFLPGYAAAAVRTGFQ